MPPLLWLPDVAKSGAPSSNLSPPIPPVFSAALSANAQFSSVQSQWENPNDILSLLMIIGGEVVQRAVVQLAGHTSYFVPTAFSFGWVGYSLNAVLLAIGEGRLMPEADCPSLLVNARNGYSKANRSWVLGRIVRDYRSDTKDTGLTVTFFKTSPISTHTQPGVPHRDWLYWSGVVVMIVQLAISVIPGAIHGNWNTLIVTSAGTLLALAGGAQRQWKNEKWACRRLKPGGREVVCLTRGNGNKDVMVIISEDEGQLRLEDLANMRDSRARYTIVFTSVLALLWFILLLTVAGLQSDAWYLLVVGFLGMIQNYIVAGSRREPGAFGIHLENGEKIHDDKVFVALQKAEERERGVGISLLPIFFPGGLRKDEEKWRAATMSEYAKHDEDEAKKQTKKKEISHAAADVGPVHPPQSMVLVPGKKNSP